MATILNRTQTFATNGTVTAAGLHNLIDDTSIYAGLITTQTELTTVGTADQLLIAVGGVSDTGAPRRATVQNLFEDTLTAGTFVGLNLSGALTYGTATGNRTVSTSATITTGTIPNLTAGTTTSTAATITTGTIPTLTAGTTTSTAANITNGTITNLSTTLAGDFTISQGTGTLGTTGATLGTYGGSASVPVLAINAKGQITSTGTAAISSGLTGFRNRIINGDMRIDQRNAGASQSYTSAPARTYSVDRFTIFYPANSKFTTQQNAGSVTPPAGFSKYLGITSSSSYSVLSSDYFVLGQPIEGQSIADLAWGTASAVSVTLSFWVRSSLTGTFGGSINNADVSRSYPFTYTISSPNTWERKTITISGDTTGTWLTNDGVGLFLWLGLGVGSTYSGTAGSWAGADYRSATGATSVVGTNGATFYITGVQLEAGSTATEFECRPIGTELALCQRYYETNYSDGYATGSTSNTSVYDFIGGSSTSGNILQTIQFKVSKRASPTVTGYNSATGALGTWKYVTSTADANGTITFDTVGAYSFRAYVAAGSNNVVARQTGNWTASAEL